MAQSPYILTKVMKYTKSDSNRLESMAGALYSVEENNIPGDIVECGVWRGGNIMLARILAPSRICWLYDTFSGMTVPHPEFDVKRTGQRAIDRYNAKLAGGTKWDAVSLDEVKLGFVECGLGLEQLNFMVGPVEETLPKCIPDSIAVLRLDVDWHSATKVSLEYLYPKVLEGGFLIVDDYGHWMGCKKAVDDYFGTNIPPYYDVDYSCRVFSKC